MIRLVPLYLSSDGKTVAIGAALNDGNGLQSGHVRVYTFDSDLNEWNQIGQDIDGESVGDNFGSSVSISSDGRTVAIVARNNSGNGFKSGHVQLYRFNDTNTNKWDQIGLDIDGEMANNGFGSSISLSSDGRTVAIGARENDGNGDRSGHVRLYGFDTDTYKWNQIGEDIDGEAANDWSGYSVSLSDDGKTVVVGAPWNDSSGNDAGHVRVYVLCD